MKKLVLMLSMLFIALFCGCSANQQLSAPIETVSPGPQTQKPTKSPEVTPAPANEPTETSEPDIYSTDKPDEIPSNVPATATTKPTEAAPSINPQLTPAQPDTTNPTEPSPTSESTPAPATEPSASVYDLSVALGENRKLLMKYVGTPSNLAITLLGLDGIVSDIRKTAQDGLNLTDKCTELANKNTNAQYYQSLMDFNSRFLECNEKTLEVKQNRDIDSFETALGNTLLTIKEYYILLEELNEKLGG